MLRRLPLFLLVCLCTGRLQAQTLEGIEIHGFVTQGFLFSSHNNYFVLAQREMEKGRSPLV